MLTAHNFLLVSSTFDLFFPCIKELQIEETNALKIQL